MLLHLTTSSLPPRALPSDPSLSSFFPSPQTLRSQNPKPHKTPIRCSAADADADTLPKTAIQRIAEKLRSLGFTDDDNQPPKPQPRKGSAGEIFVPLSTQLPQRRVGHTLDTSWSTPYNPVPAPGSGNVITRFNELRNETKQQKKLQKGLVRKKVEKVPTLAELTLSPEELSRLRTLGIGLRKKLKIGKAGVTEGIVNGIHERWIRSEVVKIVCEDFVKMNMKRTHDLLERKTGGLVVWRSGSKIILYRGANYKYPYFLADQVSTSGSPHNTSSDSQTEGNDTGNCSSGVDGVEPAGESSTDKMVKPALIQGVGLQNRVRFQLPGEAQLTEEADRLLDGLGPRFNDWWGYDPLPVDGDLLPAVIPGYRRPFRLLPYGVQPKLTNDEMTTLRRLGRPLPCHFAIGRNRKLQGLAASIVKLWEKCEIAKIAVKRGVQNTNSKIMVEELQWLTGGTMIHRDKEYIVLYRGKDFLPPAVSSAIEERRRSGIHWEKRMTANSTPQASAEDHELATVGCDSDDKFDGDNEQERVLQRKKMASEAAVKKINFKLSMAEEKKAKAEKLLEELENAQTAQQPAVDKEGITEEERYMLRKVGLRMKPFLLLGRRGVFDGTIENMHLHWKYRELVKLLCNEKSVEDAYQVAQTLEAESGGILVAVERVSKGYTIIVYRGKNYVRPTSLRPQTLLNKKAALKRSIEAQRRQSLKLHVLKLNRNIDELKLQLVKDQEVSSMLSVNESRSQSVKEEMNALETTSFASSAPELKSSDCPHPSISVSLEENAEVKEEMNALETTNFASSASELKSSDCPHPSISVSLVENAEVGDKYGVASTSVNLNEDMDTVADSLQASEENKLIGYSSQNDRNKTGNMELEPPFESATDEIPESKFTNIDGKSSCDTASGPDNHMDETTWSSIEPVSSSADADTGLCASVNDAMQSSVESVQPDLESSFKKVAQNEANELHSGRIQLSNRDRLLLRKQALMTRKRPVLAVGRSNVVTGVAKTIKEHFKKHPLAIVSIKGRAKGTSIQEVVFKLEQATGAVLVSQEPSKVILYRGWGADDEPHYINKKNRRVVKKRPAVSKEKEPRPAVSPELMEAIKFECGLL